MRNLYKSLLKSVSCLCSCNAGNSADRFQQKSHGTKSSSRSRFSGTGNGSPATRSLALEPLEDRMLLAADVWSGIDTINWSSSAVGLDAFQNNTPEVVQAVNIDTDSDSDLIAINYPDGASDKGKVTVYRNDNGSFVETVSTDINVIPAGDNAIFSTFFFDADKDGLDDDFVVLKEGTSKWQLSASVYTRNTNNTYSVSTSTIDLSSSYSNLTGITSYTVTELKGVGKGLGAGKVSTIALNLQTYTRGAENVSLSKVFGLTYDATTTQKWSNITPLINFESNLDPLPLNIVTINNVNYVACYPGTPNSLKFVNVTDNTNVIDWNFSNITNTLSVQNASVNWVAEKGGTLFLGCSQGAVKDNYYISAQFSTFTSANQTCNSEIVKVDAFVEPNDSTTAVIGNFNSDNGGVGDLMICARSTTGNNLAIYSGVGTGTQVPSFNVTSPAVLSDPDWHSVYVADLITSAGSNALGTQGKDGVNDYIFVGRDKIWIVDGARYNAATNKSDSSSFLYEISNLNVDYSITKAYFVEEGNDFIIIAQTVSPHTVSVYKMFSSEGKIAFADPGTCTPKSDPDNKNFENIQNIALGHFLDANKISVAIATESKIFLYSTENLTDQAAVASASYSFTDLGKEISLGVWSSKSGGLDKIVLVALKSETSTLYSFSYDNTNTLAKETKSYNLASGATDADEVYFSTGEKGELACLYANNHGGLSTLRYITEAGTGSSYFQTAASSNIALTSGQTYKGLYFNYLNADAYYDIVAVGQNSNGVTTIETWYGSSNGYYEKQNNSTQAVSGYPGTGIVFASATADNTSTDIIIVGDRNAYVWKNISAASGRAGNITVLCQTFDQAAATDYTVASGTARTWIDEWSNFYLEIWADSAAAKISAFTVELDYNANYFKLGTQGVVFANGYTAGTHSESAGKITLTVTGANVADKYGTTDAKVLLGKVYFTSVGGVGVALDTTNASFQSVNNGFFIDNDATTFNGLQILASNTINDAETNTYKINNLDLYPVIADLNDDGNINTGDYDFLKAYFNKTTSSISNTDKRYYLADLNNDGNINSQDYDILKAVFNKSNETMGTKFSTYYQTIGIEPVSLVRPGRASASEAAEDLMAVALESESIFTDLIPGEEEAVDLVAETVPVAAPQIDYSILLAANEAENHKLWSILDEDAKD